MHIVDEYARTHKRELLLQVNFHNEKYINFRSNSNTKVISLFKMLIGNQIGVKQVIWH